MKTWKLSDGTRVNTDGEVVGDSPLAKELARDVELVVDGIAVHVSWGLPPCGTKPLDTEDPAVMDAWIRQAAGRHGVTVESGPDVEAPLGADMGGDDPGTVY
jgi:hypothetical protein